MLTKLFTSAIVGLDGHLVSVEVDMSRGLPAFTVVGLPDTAVQESRERVRSAIRNSGAIFPASRLTVSLAPSDLRKTGTSYDLPIALGILACSEQVPPESLENALFLGEIGLDGSLRHTHGVLPMMALARKHGIKSVYVPAVDAEEAALVTGITVHAVESIGQLINHMKTGQTLPAFVPSAEVKRTPFTGTLDLHDVRGQEQAKRALEIAAAGSHNLLMSGPPGSGKTLLARCVPSILPLMTSEESLEITAIYSVAGLLSEGASLVVQRPFRAPHFTVSNAGLVGGGSQPRPGEITLSHNGVLFLDELPEFGHALLDSLRQPLEDRRVTISRARGAVTYPANFMLIAAMNPCPCGYYGDSKHECTCGEKAIMRYKRHVSGPFLDRMDIFVAVPRVDYDKLTTTEGSSNVEAIRARVQQARMRQIKRFKGTGIYANSGMGPGEVWEHCNLDAQANLVMRAAMDKLSISGRGFHRILKVGRTIADLKDMDIITVESLSEALALRH